MELDIWKIGTNVGSMIKEWKNMVFPDLKSNIFSIVKDSKDKYFLKYNKNHGEPGSYTLLWSDTKLRQNIISMVNLGILEIVDFNKDNWISDYEMILNGNIQLKTKFFLDSNPTSKIIYNHLFSEMMQEEFNCYFQYKKEQKSNSKNDDDETQKENHEYFFKSFKDITFYNSFFVCLLKDIYKFSNQKFSILIEEKPADANKFYKYYDGFFDLQEFSPQEQNNLEELAVSFLFASRKEFDRVTGMKTTKNKRIKADNDPHKKQFLELEDNIREDFKKANSRKEMLSEIRTFGEILFDIKNRNHSYKIPIYQRDYKWNEEMIEKLFDDIFTGSNDDQGKKIHYMGTLLVNRPRTNDNSNLSKVVDGQQRLTSLIIILKAIHAEIIDRDIIPDPFIHEIMNTKNYRNLIEMSFERISGNPDTEAFKELLTNAENPKNPYSQIWKNYGFLLEQKLDSELCSDEELFNLTEFILRRVLFTITTDYSENEFEIFENMNTKKVELETIELIKNIIMMQIQDKVLEENEANINLHFDTKILKEFRDTETKNQVNSTKINNFIAAFVNYYQCFLDENDKLYKTIQTAANNKNELYSIFKEIVIFKIKEKTNSRDGKINLDEYNEIINFLNEHILLFKSVTDRKYYQNTNNSTHILSDILINFEGRTIYTPLIMFIVQKYMNSYKEILNHNELRRVLFVIENYENRFQVVLYRGQSLTNTMNKVLEKVAKARKINDAFLKEQFMSSETMNKIITPSNEQFKADLKTKISDKTLKNLIRRVDFWLANGCSLNLNPTHEWFKVLRETREHIIPQKLNDEWIEILKRNLKTNDINAVNKKHAETLEILGNGLLINHSPNAAAKNNVFKIKKQLYESDPNIKDYYQYKGYDQNEVFLMDLSKKEEFNFDDAENRTKQLIEIIMKIYDI